MEPDPLTEERVNIEVQAIPFASIREDEPEWLHPVKKDGQREVPPPIKVPVPPAIVRPMPFVSWSVMTKGQWNGLTRAGTGFGSKVN